MSPAIRLSAHARQRLAARGIPLAWVEYVLARPDVSRADPTAATTRSFRAIPQAGGRVLRVVHRQAGAEVLVITAFLDRGARR